MQQQRAGCGACSGNRCRRFGIDAECDVGIGLGPIHRGVGRGIDHHVRRDAGDEGGQRSGRIEIGDGIRAGAIARCHHQLAQRRQAAPQFTADLAVAAEQQQPHARYCGRRSGAISARSGAAASLADSEASASGQSIASAGSSQRSELSLARS